MSTMQSRSTLLALLLAAPGLAQAIPEVEANHPATLGQTVTIRAESGQTTGEATIEGVVGVLSGPAAQDLDFFVFNGKEGDVVTLDIDMGMGGLRSVDTIIAVFGAGPDYPVLRMNDDGGAPLDPGSISGFDSRIVNFRLPATGAYTVGVSSYPRRFVNGGGTSTNNLGANANGDYTLIISGVSVSVLQINIDIKPGSAEVAPINPKARGRIPVALLGSSEFSVEDVDTDSLTFGHTGNEASLAKCGGGPRDVNGDAFPDLVCHFENQTAHFDSSDDEAILRGELDDGRKFEGRGWLKVVPVKAQR